MAELALAWVLRRPEVASAITGASRPEQVHANAKASGITAHAGHAGGHRGGAGRHAGEGADARPPRPTRRDLQFVITGEDGRSSTVTASDRTTDANGTGQYAEVNGINLYFETHGAGRPLILLHGGLGSGEMFGPVLPALAERHQVIAVDLQGHGRTADIDRPIDVRLMADDIAALIDHLGLDTPDLVGYSLGGGVALHTAVKYPAKVGRLVDGLGQHPARRDLSGDARRSRAR